MLLLLMLESRALFICKCFWQFHAELRLRLSLPVVHCAIAHGCNNIDNKCYSPQIHELDSERIKREPSTFHDLLKVENSYKL